MIKRRNWLAGVFLAVCLVASGCASDDSKPKTTAPPEEIITGPSGVTAFVDKVPTRVKQNIPRLSALPLREAPFPLAETFTLNSYPGAQRTIYLDFNGETITGTNWTVNYNSGNPIVAAAFDSDGNAGSFSESEQTIIQGVWQRVAEDFIGFAINVTTQDPGADAIHRTDANDAVYGTRVLITNMTTIQSGCGCSGLAWVGTFDFFGTDHPASQPVLVFQRAIGAVEKNIAETTSHEAGHSLGLSHDGGGNPAQGSYYGGVTGSVWAPIMGMYYYKPLTHWSKGEYPSPSNTENDFGVVLSNGAGIRPDDHSNATTGATALGAGRSGSGIIGSTSDVDVFSFTTTGGQITWTANPAPRGPNLDIQLDLLDAAGAVLSTSNPLSSAPIASNPDSITGINATVTRTLTSGTYHLRIAGIGAGSVSGTGYSDYSSIGQYSFAAVAAPTTPSFVVNNVTKTELDAGKTISYSFTVTLSAAATSNVTVKIATANGTAVAPGDYTTKALTTLTFAPGVVKKTFAVVVKGDGAVEGNETFFVNLSAPVGATISDAQGVGTITNDD